MTYRELDPRLDLPAPATSDVASTLARVTAALRRAVPVSSPLLRLVAATRATDTVDDLLARTGWSARTLQRRFQAALGVSPKQHLRYLRFETALAAR